MKRLCMLLGTIVLLLFVPSHVFACTSTVNDNLAISSSCSFTGTVAGVDNGNIVIGSEATLTVLSGQTLVWNSGKTISNDGSIAFIGTAQIVKSSLWCTDADTDGYCATQTYSYGDTSPEAGYRRLMNMTSLARSDCNDSVSGLCKRVFVMAVSNAALGGLSGANTLCQNRANTYLVAPGTFKAWLSTSDEQSATNNLAHSSMPYYLADTSTVVADEWKDLIDGTIYNEINLDANGSTITGEVFTNTTTTGGNAGVNNCNFFSTGYGPSDSTRGGYSYSTSSTWTLSPHSPSCASAANIYCFEQ